MSPKAPRSSYSATKPGLPRSTTAMPRFVVRVKMPTFPITYLADGFEATTMRERAKEFTDRTDAMEALQSLNATWVQKGEVFP